MDYKTKSMLLLGMSVIGVAGLILMAKNAQHRHCNGTYEKVGQSIDHRLMEARESLEKASVQVQNVFEHIKNMKS